MWKIIKNAVGSKQIMQMQVRTLIHGYSAERGMSASMQGPSKVGDIPRFHLVAFLCRERCLITALYAAAHRSL